MKRMRWLALLLAALLALSLGGCFLLGDDGEEQVPDPEETAYEPDPEYPVTAGGVTLSARPNNVISLAPALTEKLYDLGLEGRLTGVSDYCDYPSTLDSLPRCGTQQAPDLDEILRIHPHLVLTEGALTDEVMEEFAALDIPVAVLPRADSVDELMRNYRDLAMLMEGAVSGAAMGEACTRAYLSRLGELESAVAGMGGDGGTALYLRMLNLTVAPGGTFEHDMMTRIGLTNVAAAETGWEYPESGISAFADIDVIFMDPDFVTITDLEQNGYYRGLAAVIQDRYLYISAIEMERQSMRSLFLLEDMAAYVYQGLANPAARPSHYAEEEAAAAARDARLEEEAAAGEEDDQDNDQ